MKQSPKQIYLLAGRASAETAFIYAAQMRFLIEKLAGRGKINSDLSPACDGTGIATQPALAA